MVIKDIAVSFPSRRVYNEEITDMIRVNSHKVFKGDLERMLTYIEKLLVKTGLERRNWCAVGRETPMDHVSRAVKSALNKTYLQPHQIDLFVYVGVGRGFIEPGNSYMMAKALGAYKAECFDILDACMSWTRALSVVNSLFKTEKYRNAVVVNAEFGTINEKFLLRSLTLSSEDQLAYTFPTYTIGDAATACLLTNEKPDNFSFNFSSNTEFADLCTMPLPTYELFCHPTEQVGKNGPMNFTSYGVELHEYAGIEAPKVLKEAVDRAEADIVFTHASSKTAWEKFGTDGKIVDKLFHIYPHTGNLVSASIPAAIALASQQGRLQRGDKALSWVASAGMSFNSTTFTF